MGKRHKLTNRYVYLIIIFIQSVYLIIFIWSVYHIIFIWLIRPPSHFFYLFVFFLFVWSSTRRSLSKSWTSWKNQTMLGSVCFALLCTNINLLWVLVLTTLLNSQRVTLKQTQILLSNLYLWSQIFAGPRTPWMKKMIPKHNQNGFISRIEGRIYIAMVICDVPKTERNETQ